MIRWIAVTVAAAVMAAALLIVLSDCRPTEPPGHNKAEHACPAEPKAKSKDKVKPQPNPHSKATCNS